MIRLIYIAVHVHEQNKSAIGVGVQNTLNKRDCISVLFKLDMSSMKLVTIDKLPMVADNVAK